MDLLIRLNLERCKFYLSRVELKPKQAAFLYGWLLRTITLHKKFYNGSYKILIGFINQMYGTYTMIYIKILKILKGIILIYII